MPAGSQAGEGGAEMITVSQIWGLLPAGGCELPETVAATWHGSLAQPDGIIIKKRSKPSLL